KRHGNAAHQDSPMRRKAGKAKRTWRGASSPLVERGGSSEEVPDGELEQIGVVDRSSGEREPDLETKRAQRREPAYAETRAHEQPERKRAVSVRVGALAALEEVLVLGEDVARVVEDDAADAGR